MKNLIILHGNKLNNNGNLSTNMEKRINTLFSFLEKLNVEETTLVISGGKTRKGYESEAKTIFNSLKENLKFYKHLRVLLEEESKTTIENLINIKNLLSTEAPQAIYVITNNESQKRVRYLFKLAWPEIYKSLSFVEDNHPTVLKNRIIEFLNYSYSLIDPYNKMLKYPIRLFRNG